MQDSAEVGRLQAEYDKIESAISVYEAKHGQFPICSGGNNTACNISTIISSLTVDGVPTKNPDDTDIQYRANDDGGTSPAWSDRLRNMRSEEFCRVVRKPYEAYTAANSRFSSAPSCW